MDEVRAAPDAAAVRVGAVPSVTTRAGDVMARGEESQPAAAHVEDSEPHGPGDGEHDVDPDRCARDERESAACARASPFEPPPGTAHAAAIRRDDAVPSPTWIRSAVDPVHR